MAAFKITKASIAVFVALLVVELASFNELLTARERIEAGVDASRKWLLIVLYNSGALIWMLAFQFSKLVKPDLSNQPAYFVQLDQKIRGMSWWIGGLYFFIPMFVMVFLPYGASVWFYLNMPLSALLGRYLTTEGNFPFWFLVSVFNTGNMVFVTRFVGRRLNKLI